MPRKYKDFTKNILLDLAAVGVIAVAASSPYFLINIAKAIVRNKKYIKKKIDARKVAKALYGLRKNRLIILREENKKFTVEITEKGKRKVKEIQFENMEIKKPLFWDGKWRIVIFDIPDKKKRDRDALREKLQELDFYLLQKSVWAYPYSCEKEIQFLCELFDISSFVNIITAEKIYDDIKTKKYFDLL